LVVKNKKKQKRVGRKKKILPSSLFFYFLFSSCDLVFSSYWDFFPLANPFASPHVFVHAGWFILTLFMFCHHSCPIARA
jgi:hypothetical protein